jgi:uncharacterized phage protein (TIGR01671 family)
MKREIKFRAWNKSKKQMVKSYAHFDRQGILHGSLNILGDTYIPLQYTGLKDKNNKEIYEGDILTIKSKSEPKYITTIELGWTDDDEYGWYWLSNQGTKNIIRDVDFVSERYEVIGNIYENPDFLKSD